MYKRILLVILLPIILSSMFSPIISVLAGYNPVERSSELVYKLKSYPDFWLTLTNNNDLLDLVVRDIIPVNGALHDSDVEKTFWEKIVPRGYANHFYEELLFNKLIPGNASDGYYYYRFFHDVIAEDYRAYRMNNVDAEPFVSRDAFIYYHTMLFGHLIPENYSNGYYYNEVFYHLYKDNVWGFGEILAWIAYYNEFGPFYPTTLTRIDLEGYTGDFNVSRPSDIIEPLEVVEPGTLRVELYGPTGALENVVVNVYEEYRCPGSLGCSGDFIASGITDENGSVELTLPPGRYLIKLYGPVAGIIRNVIVEPSETTVVEKLLGMLTIRVNDAQGNGIQSLTLGLYEQVTGSGGVANPGEYITSITLGSNGSTTLYMVEGTYMAEPYIPGLYTYIENIIVNAGQEHQYSYTLDVVKVTIVGETPVSTQPYSFRYVIRYPAEGPEYGWSWGYYGYYGVGTIWLKPGDYSIEITEVWTGSIDYDTSININFSVGYTGETTVSFQLPAVTVVMPPLKPGVSVRYDVWRTLDPGKKHVHSYLGSLDFDNNVSYVITPGTYYLEPVLGWNSSNYGFTAEINSYGVYNYEIDAPIGYLNISTVFGTTPVYSIMYAVYLQEENSGYPYLSDQVGYYTSNELVPLLPGIYGVRASSIGLLEPIYDISVVEDASNIIVIGLGRIVVNATSFNNTPAETSIPVLVFPYDNETGEPDWNTLVTTVYTSNGIASIDIVPGVYALAIPGANVTYYWQVQVGYGEVVANVTVEAAHVADVSFSLGRLLVNIIAPYDYEGSASLYLQVYTQRIVNGTPIPDELVYSGYVWGTPWLEEVELTPGSYFVGLGTYYGSSLINGTARNVSIEPNGMANVSYELGLIQVGLVMSNGEAIPNAYVEVYTPEGQYITGVVTDVNGTARFLLPEGDYVVGVEMPDCSYVYCNVSSVPSEVNWFNLTLPTGLLRIHLIGPDGEPVPDYEAYAVSIDSYYSFYDRSDANGTVLLFVPAGNYNVHPEFYPGGFSGVETSVGDGDVVDICFNLSLIMVYLNTSFNSTRSISLVVANEYDVLEYMYTSITRFPTPIYVMPGNYLVSLPGLYTKYQGGYGYGEECNVTIGDNEVVNVTFNITAIRVVLYTNTSLDRSINAILYEQTDASLGWTIDYLYISSYYGPNPSSYFIVSPGTYAVALSGPPYSYWSWGSAGQGHVWYNVSASLDDIPVLGYEMGLAIITAYANYTPVPGVYTSLYAVYDGYNHLVDSRYTNEYGHVYYYLTEGEYYVSTVYGGTYFNVTRGDITYVSVNASVLEVYLKGPDGEPVVDAMVYIYDESMSYEMGSEYTDSEGKAVFFVDPGNYTIVLKGYNYFYDPYNAVYHYNINFGNGYAEEVYVSDHTSVNINLSRIDLYVEAPSSPASDVFTALYDPTGLSPIKGAYTGSDGVARYYVTNGSYRLIIRGYYYGWYDYYYFSIPYDDNAGYGDLVSEVYVSSLGEKYNFTYDIPELYVYVNSLDGEPMEGIDVNVYTSSYDWLRTMYTGSDGVAIAYLTPGEYYVGVDGLDNVLYNITEPITYHYNTSFAKIEILVEAPESTIGSTDYVSVYFYKNYSGPGTGEYIGSISASINETCTVYLPSNISIAAIIPGLNTTGTYYSPYGYGDVRYFTTNTSPINITFRLSRIVFCVVGPWGSIGGIEITVRPSIIGYGGTQSSTNPDGYAEFLLTEGSYTYYLPYVSPPNKYFDLVLGECELKQANVSLGALIINHLHVENAPPLYILITEASGNYPSQDYAIYDQAIIYAYSGVYNVSTGSWHGWIVEKTAILSELSYAVLNFSTGELELHVRNIDGEPVGGQYAYLYLQEDGSTGLGVGRYVTYAYVNDYGIGRFTTLTQGYYVLMFPGETYTNLGFSNYFYNASVTPITTTVYNITLGRLMVSIIHNNGTPETGHEVRLYTLYDSTIWWLVDTKYTNENGSAMFDVTGGEYALWIDGLGYVYGVIVYEGELTNLTYTVEPANLAVANISWTPTNPSDGDTVFVTANITNYGPGSVFTDFNVRFYLNNTLVKTITVHGLLAGYYTLVTAPITAIAGIDEIKVTVDEDLRIYDLNRTNNEMTTYITVTKPDLAVLSALVEGELYDGSTATLRFNITNLGPGDTHRLFYVNVYHNGDLIRVLGVNGLGVGEIVELSTDFTIIAGTNDLEIYVDPADEISEVDEINNILHEIIYVPLPDLAVVNASITCDEWVEGGIAAVNATISNIGGSATRRPFFTKLFIDGVYMSSAYHSGKIDVNESFNIVFYILLKGGDHNVTVVIDPEERVPDANRSNNMYSMLYSLPAPDLELTWIDVEQDVVSEGEEFTIIFNVTNSGIGETRISFYIDLYVDSDIENTIYIDTPLLPGDLLSRSFTLSLDSGNHTLEVIVDSTNRTGDIDRTNNVGRVNVTVLNSDLEALGLYINTTELHNNGYAEAIVTIRNNGPGDVTKQFYIALFDNDEFIYQEKIENALGVGEVINVSIPLTLKTGNRTYTAVVDDHYQVCYSYTICVYAHRHEISDPDRGNNNISATIYVPGPNLVVTNITVSPETLDAWGYFTVNVTVANNGDYNVDYLPWLRLVIDESYYMLSSDISLAPGEEATLSTTIYEGLPPGNHSITAFIDPFNEVYEHNEDDNTFASWLYIPYPDLVVTGVYVDNNTILDHPSMYSVTVTVRNDGWNFTHDFIVAIMIEGATDYVRRVFIEGDLSSGDEVNVTLSMITRPPGNLAYTVKADYADNIPESNESNNYAVFKSPLLRSLDIPRTTILLWLGVWENDTLRIVNTGSIPLEITSISLNVSWMSVEHSLPVALEPSEYIDVPIHVDTEAIGLGVWSAGIAIETNASLLLNETLYINILDPACMFTINTSSYLETSLTGHIDLMLGITSTFYPSEEYIVEFSGNASSMLVNVNSIAAVEGTGTHVFTLYADPSAISEGLYALYINVTIQEFGVSRSTLVEVMVYRDPLIEVIAPLNNSCIPSNTLVITWETNVWAGGTIYFRDLASPTYTEIDYEEDTYHTINIGGLLINHTYEFYITAVTDAGSSTTGIYRVTVLPSVGFSSHEITVTINRDYMQTVDIVVENYDECFGHYVMTWIDNPYADLIMNFIGSGSIDEETYLTPLSSKILTLAIHAADAVFLNYTVTAILLNLDNNVTDVMTIHIIIKEPVFNVTVEYLGMDNHTLIQTYKLVNHGDTIADLSVYLTGPASSFAYIYPSMNHARVEAGSTMIFYIIPVLSMLPEDPRLTNGTIIVETKDPSSYNFSTHYFKPPKGYTIYRIILKSMTLSARAADWYCTNRPSVKVKMKISTDPPSLTGDALLFITFTPKSDVKPHDGSITVNGYPVYSWSNTIPSGTVSAPVPLDVLGLNPKGGVSEAIIDINTQHMNGGHYIVATDFRLLVNVKGGVYYIAAKNDEEAREKVYEAFKPNMVAVEPISCKFIQEPPAYIKAIITAIKGGYEFDLGKVDAPSILKNLFKTAISVKAKVYGQATIGATTISVGIYGELNLEFGMEVIEGKLWGNALWAIKNCEWKFCGGEIGGSLMYGKKMAFPLPKTWLKYINDYGIKLEAKVVIGISEAKIKLNERLRIDSLQSLMIGIEISGMGELDLGDGDKLSLELKLGGYFGWENNAITGKVTVSVKGDLSIDLTIWEYTYSGEYGVKFVYTSRTGWEVKPYSDPYATLYNYYFYPEQLDYPYIMLANQYTSSTPSLSYMPGKGLVAVWIASDGNKSTIMYSVYNGTSWSTPEEVPTMTTDLWYTGVKTAIVKDKLFALVTGIKPFDPSGMSYDDVEELLGNKTLYYMAWDGSSWSMLMPITTGVAGLYDIASHGDTAIAVWKTNTSDGEAIACSIMKDMVWSSPSIITGTVVGGGEFMIRDLAVGYINGEPVIVWTRDVYRGVEDEMWVSIATRTYYTLMTNGSWTAPLEVPGAVDAWSLDVVSSGDTLYAVWSMNNHTLYVTTYNGSSWSSSAPIGLGLGQEAVYSGGRLFVLARAFYNVSYRDIALYIVNTSTLGSSPVQYVTHDAMDDREYDIGATPTGRLIIVWTRRPSNTTELPENYTYAYGLYYTRLSEISLTGLDLSTNTTVEGTPVTVYVNVTNYGDEEVSLDVVVLLNNSIVYSNTLTILADTTISEIFNVTPLHAGVYWLEVKLVNMTSPSIYPELSRGSWIESRAFMEVYEPVNESFVEGVVSVRGFIDGLNPANVIVAYVRDSSYTIIANLTSVLGSWETPFDTTAISDGPVRLIVEASILDRAVTREHRIMLHIDNTPPHMEVINPANNTYVSGLVNVTVNAYDNYYPLPTPPLYRINMSNWIPLETLGEDIYYAILNTTEYPDGTMLFIELYVVDTSGKTVLSSLLVTVDNTPPDTTDNSTAEWFNRDVIVVLSPTDNLSGVNTTYYRVDGGEWFTGATVYIPAPSDHSNDGVHSIEYYSIDNAGNIEPTRTAHIYIDTEPPAISIYGVYNASYVKGVVQVYGVVSDLLSGVESLLMSIDDGVWNNVALTNGSWSYVLDTTILNDGEHVLSIMVVDEAENSQTTTIEFIVDNTVPLAEFISPVNGSLVSETITIEFSYSDVYLDKSCLIIDGELIDVTGSYSYALDTTMYPDGALVILLNISDKAGNYNSSTIIINIDNTPPTASIISPEDNALVEGVITIEYNYSDPHLDIAYIIVDGVSTQVTATASYILNTSELSDGVHTIELHVVDTLGHKTVVGINIIVDNTPPELTVISPENNTLVNGLLTISHSLIEDNLFHIDLIVNGEVLEEYYEPKPIVVDTTSYGDGECTIEIRAVDKLGHTTTVALVLVIDNTPPEVEIISPANATIVTEGPLEVMWSIIEPHLDKAVLYIDGEPVNVTGLTSYAIDVDELDEGLHNITLYAIDKLGQDSSTTIFIEKQTLVTPPPLGVSVELAIAAAVIIVVIAVVVIFLRRRR